MYGIEECHRTWIEKGGVIWADLGGSVRETDNPDPQL